MSTPHKARPTSPLSPQLITSVYLPSAVVLIGVGIAKIEWLPFAAVIPIVLIALQFYGNVVKKALRPDIFQEFKLQKKDVISHNVAIYRFSLQTPTHILGLPIGQHMSLAATLDVNGQQKEVVRSYTPISSDENPGYFDLLIKSYPQGNISQHLTTLQLGDTMKVKGPKGAMVYTPNMCKRIGMIAGGTGITPMLQVIRAIVRGRPRNGGNDHTQVDLIFANVNPEDILLKENLDTLAKEDEGFRVLYVLNNPPEKWEGGVGFVTADMIKEHLPAPGLDMKLLMCGPPPMISAMKKAAESVGYTKPRAVSKLEDQVFCF
ncbi:NADH-cytochrome b5 reductase [Bacidia gigantensis]|uniref:NADH-cytochrome b5 reductase n=1 Tax=Bacidia gigantensis TaxID=2732470 RepID=UPI001D05003F|nr:NADH-cytochrome b5 reductase [Bacidia gigantensis]KAG8531400.1 NADH-cytochrome b5 reductase [Bacidia gigantensis]